jgi:hypothetical protein
MKIDLSVLPVLHSHVPAILESEPTSRRPAFKSVQLLVLYNSLYIFSPEISQMNDSEGELKYGQSEFHGPPSLQLESKRWVVQFFALLIKNYLIIKRRKLSLLSFLLLPSFIILVFIMQKKDSVSTPTNYNLPTVPIVGLGECNVYFSERCVRVVYSPQSPMSNVVMQSFSESNSLSMGSDVLGFSSTESAQRYVAGNLGTVQYTVFFRNESLWETSYYSSSTQSSPSSNMSYVIFYNDTVSINDDRSQAFGMNFQLLALQKSLDTAYLQNFHADMYITYDVKYGQFWQQANTDNITASNTTSFCDLSQRSNMAAMQTAMPWVVTFCFLFMATISFQLIAEERRQKLFGFLRRLGLMDSAYWASWFVTFQVLLIIACIIAIIGTSVGL